MANTLIPIQTVTVGSGGASSIDFTNIPQNYTDLLVVYSLRSTYASDSNTIYISFNGSTSSFSDKGIYGNGASAASNSSARNIGALPAATATANTFSNGQVYIPNYTSSNYKSFSVDNVQENNVTATYTDLRAGLWSNNAAINQVTIISNVNNLAQNSTATLYGISNGVKATGGTIICAGGYAYHTFTSTGSFLPNQQIKGAEILAVAGGGGSSGAGPSAPGGAGGVLYSNLITFNAGTTYTALVGAGGAVGSNGANSVVNSFVAIGGGTGFATGGSGGGTWAATPISGTVGQGNAGGAGVTHSGPDYEVTGGGGGAGGVGGTGVYGQAGAGGVGTSNYTVWHAITGTGVLSNGVYYIAGGGGGNGDRGSSAAGAGGVGGGGAGGSSGGGAATGGTTNTGGGAGGAGYNYPPNTNGAGAAGGSGLIIVRYPLS
jgi:hypothetical protein